MILKKLKLINIRSYKELEITFPPGSTLLMGDVGSGKTSILLAIEFALFGLQPSQRGNSLLRNNEQEASVTLEFEIDDQEVIIERKLKKGSKSISQGDASISIDNARFDGSVTEIKNKVLSLLNYPGEFAKKTNDLYKFTVYTPQEEMKQIILESPATRLNTLRHVFGIDKYKRIAENLEVFTKKLRQEIRLKEAELGNIDEKKQSLENKKTSLLHQETKLKELDLDLDKVKTEKQNKEQEIKELESKISEKRNFETDKATSETTLNHKSENLRALEIEFTNLERQVQEGKKFDFKEADFNLLQSRIESQKQIKKQNEEELFAIGTKIQSRDTKKIEADQLKNKIMGLEKCPTCLQNVNQEYKENIVFNANNEIRLILERNKEDEAKRQGIRTKIEQINKQIDSFETTISEMKILKFKLDNLKEKEQRMEEIGKQKRDSISEIETLKSKIKQLISTIQGFDIYANRFEEKNKELQEISSKQNNLLITQAEINKEIQFLKIQIKEIEETITRLEEISKKINEMKELEYWLNNKFLELILFTEKNVMLKLREEFSTLFSNWFSILVSDELKVRLDESFSPIIEQQDYELDYNFLSGGERTAVALAYRLALNQVINSLLSKIKTHDLVILDEPTDGFSDSQLDKMREVLSQLQVKQLILVSHEQKIEGFVDNIIRLNKSEGMSEIEGSIISSK